ncbi:hypothetical protein A3H75_02745 [Candidatus Uhrbacteria bacterium RIFCSPLOWO2_02_FULL_51_9]|uniref:Uncharacterized protein n=1 Tax=Candidatus Uhrbacteria bacterium RIFCSPLOWO2_02_FULL_51_9 TaxID=1802410 RepID=A0A1F7VDZ0_9BACT|nr:MAG: hypothetical protein A3H75_02745 [Candidatus Uhrbacteria bacterium RIFCSPLOWO2_02_FULL_51_9]
MFDKPLQPNNGAPIGSPPSKADGGEGGQAPPVNEADVVVTGHPILDKPTALESGRLQAPSAPPSPPSLQPSVASSPPAQLSGPMLHPTKSNKIKWVILAVVLVALLGALGVWVYLLNRPSDDKKEIVIPSKVEAVVPVEPVDVDTDKDALMDSREKELGTDKNNPDSDFDGLTDNEEVTLWNTDPLIDDTDKDGYKDGDEVGNGYNPAGPGRLFNINDTNL